MNSNCSLSDIFKRTVIKTENDFMNVQHQQQQQQPLQQQSQQQPNDDVGNSGHTPRINIESPRKNMTPAGGGGLGNMSPKIQPLALGNLSSISQSNATTASDPASQYMGALQPIRLSINSSKKSNIYVLVTIAICNITDCHDCTIVLGPCCDYIEVSDCSSLTIIAITKGIRVKSSSSMTLNICTNQKPIINTDCTGIRLAPYNTHYSTLESQITLSKLQVNLASNQWCSPLVFKSPMPSPLDQSPSLQSDGSVADLTNDLKLVNMGGGDTGAGQSHIYTLVEPDDFYPFTVPFVLKGRTKANPCELPPKYAKALSNKTSSVQSLHKLVQQSTNDQRIRGHILHLVESKFQDWLIETDNIRQINDLINMKK
ncbi:hypothetical protein SAMD00019534_057620 [Acytostelium subglobosum LB1]|uniref:hypothetical protein n=1 Tax=Acytostelium subglobosum LB1 TaxID=1410327 RepID=UPI00064512F0|nr:hypothetical protein SAMD00019534_057620 [Acytostelium subglobosum LB1]GAM22587.1 hypothetical protein SAMD00019534_057620 [Acytostelium subglobosum LB1]|eukprot:XP_012754707.1 hypothetical protein SAMD00019534_057620 [Acytostelium subglobosum LB1]